MPTSTYLHRLPHNSFLLQASTRRQKIANVDTYLDQVVQLNDQELADELKLYGQAPGPITDTTRRSYQRQLAKRMAEKAKGEKRMDNVGRVECMS